MIVEITVCNSDLSGIYVWRPEKGWHKKDGTKTTESEVLYCIKITKR